MELVDQLRHGSPVAGVGAPEGLLDRRAVEADDDDALVVGSRREERVVRSVLEPDEEARREPDPGDARHDHGEDEHREEAAQQQASLHVSAPPAPLPAPAASSPP